VQRILKAWLRALLEGIKLLELYSDCETFGTIFINAYIVCFLIASQLWQVANKMNFRKILKSPSALLLLVITVQSFIIDEVIEEDERGKQDLLDSYFCLEIEE